VHRQFVERIWCFIHHIDARTAVHVDINVSRTKQVCIVDHNARGDWLYFCNDAVFNVYLMIVQPAPFGQ